MRRTFPATDVAAAVGAAAVSTEAVAGGGYGTNTAKWRVELVDGRRAFVKLALDDVAADWLRAEHRVYSHVHEPFLPTLHGWHDADGRTLLVLEDLGHAHWPPPWSPTMVDAVFEALDAVHATDPPPGLRPRGRARAAPRPLLDVVAWLPSLRLEGGPQPWELLSDSRGLASLIAGFFASRAGLPVPETAPTVREFQRRQAEIALPWAARELDLDPRLGA